MSPKVNFENLKQNYPSYGKGVVFFATRKVAAKAEFLQLPPYLLQKFLLARNSESHNFPYAMLKKMRQKFKFISSPLFRSTLFY